MHTTSYREELEELTKKLNLEDEMTVSLLTLTKNLIQLVEQQQSLITKDIRGYLLESDTPPSYLKVIK